LDFLRTVSALVWKDLLAERRTREILSAMLIFALVVILIFVFAFNLSIDTRRNAAAGVIWATLCFSGTIGLNRSMAIEKEHGGLDGLLLAPVDRVAIFIGKAVTNWIYMVIIAFIILPVYSLFNNTNLISFGIVGVVLVGTLGYSVTGTLLAALALQLRSREMLLPVLLFPVLIPLLLAAIRATTVLLQSGGSGELSTWIALLVAYDLIFIAVSVMVFDKIVEE
jgi:heme exporter protein B